LRRWSCRRSRCYAANGSPHPAACSASAKSEFCRRLLEFSRQNSDFITCRCRSAPCRHG
jgi:hypothetical protein